MNTLRTLPRRPYCSSLLLTVLLGLSACVGHVELGSTSGIGGSTSAIGAGGQGDATQGGSVSPGGSSTVAGATSTVLAGTGGATSTFKRLVVNTTAGLDLLLMVDNSASMADKQATLAEAVPRLLGQLVQPACTNADGSPVLDGSGQPTHVLLGAGTCPSGGSPEFKPVNDIHIGIVTSSLGDHGGDNLCTPGKPTSFVDSSGNTIVEPDDVNDKAHLVGTLARYSSGQAATARATVDPAGFLAWGDASNPPMTDSDLVAAAAIFTDMVSATKEMGCGLEAQLESWFRFLIDPVPPIYPIQKDSNQQTTRLGSDDALLAQRAAFLRPDSSVAIIMLTDENDCSLRDTDVGWVATDTRYSIKSGSSACATNPNDPCCYSCTAGGPPGHCTDGCANKGAAQDDGSFQANIRCFHQKRRFGYEFLYPTSRYVVALQNKELCPDQTFGDMDCDCKFAKSIGASCNPGSRKLPNPLYSNVIGTNNTGNSVQSNFAATPREDNSSVFLAGIVGVPWQDIASLDANGNLAYIPVTDQSWTGSPSSNALTPINPAPSGIWANIYGDDNSNVVPQDPHMVESLEHRQGIAASDIVNGHDWNTAYEDLEYACIYTLPQPRSCACSPDSTDYSSCKYQHPNDCCDSSYSVDGRSGPGGDFNKPLCNGNTQVAAKAYPALREIAVLHDYAVGGPAQGNSIVASICPKDLSSSQTSPGYGYNPVADALMQRLKPRLSSTSCLARPITVDSQTGAAPCNLVEVVGAAALDGQDCTSYCTSNGRSSVSTAMGADVTAGLQLGALCDRAGTPACSSLCQCLLAQESPSKNALGAAQGSDLAVCQNADDATVNNLPPGYCYVDPSAGAGSNPDLVARCPDTQPRIVRFAGDNPVNTSGVTVPLKGAMLFLSCGTSVQ